MKNERRLTTTSYALLAQLSLRPWSTYELAQQRVRYFRFVWPRAESAIYREVKHLAAQGLVEGEVGHTGRRKRTVYSITEEGTDALRDWLGTPVSPFSMNFEAMIRLFVAPLGTTDQIVDTLEQVRFDAQEMLKFGGEVKQEYMDGRGALQDEVYVRALAIDFFISLVNTVDTWTDRTLAEINAWDDMTIDERNRRGMELLATVPVATPASPSTETPVAPSSQTRGDSASRPH
jgi:PadR family transcriptional regulator AphA